MRRAGKKLAAVTRAFAAKDGPCKSVDAYGLANTMAGYDAKTGELAFSITAQQCDAICFSHDFVVTLKSSLRTEDVLQGTREGHAV